MIQPVTIDIINDKALKLLKDLELMQLIRLYKDEANPKKIINVDKYKGSMTKQPLTDVDNQLNEFRNR